MSCEKKRNEFAFLQQECSSLLHIAATRITTQKCILNRSDLRQATEVRLITAETLTTAFSDVRVPKYMKMYTCEFIWSIIKDPENDFS